MLIHDDEDVESAENRKEIGSPEPSLRHRHQRSSSAHCTAGPRFLSAANIQEAIGTSVEPRPERAAFLESFRQPRPGRDEASLALRVEPPAVQDNEGGCCSRHRFDSAVLGERVRSKSAAAMDANRKP